MQAGLQFPVKSLAATQFTEALAPGAASALYSIGLPQSLWRRALVQSLTIVSKDNVAWEINLFSSATGPTTDPTTDTWLGRWTFGESDGEQIGGTGLWRYVIEGLGIAYVDLDGANNAAVAQTLHVIVVNKSLVNTKAANAAGALTLTAVMELMAQNS